MKQNNNMGFTIPEFIIAALITTLAVAAAMSGFIYVLHAERKNSIQVELDMDVRKSIEWLRHDLRLADMDKIVFYPAGAGPYQAICFPMVNFTGAASQALQYDTNGLILWDKTVMYHVLTTTPYQLRMTVFSNRNNDLSITQRQDQLNRVVAAGDGSTVTCESNWSTRVIFENLVEWDIWPQRAVYDGYNAQSIRDIDHSLGSIILSNGMHTLTFTVVGKNPLSSGYRIGLDTLYGSVCNIPREGENQRIVQSGATATTNYRSVGSWSGNYDMLFSATATGQTLSLAFTNDCWEECNFDESGTVCERSVVEFDMSLWPYYDKVVGLEPYAWDNYWSSRQTLDYSLPPRYTSNDTLRGCAIRVLIRGKDMPGSSLQNEGNLYFLGLMGGPSGLKIKRIYFAECASQTNPVPDALNDGLDITALTTWNTIDNGAQWGALSIYMPYPWTNFYIRESNSYVVSFLVEDQATRTDAVYWQEKNPGLTGCWMIPQSANPDEDDTRAAVWSTNVTVVASSNLYALYATCILSPSNGFYTSQIIDTQQDGPRYTYLNWNWISNYLTGIKMRIRTSDTNDMATAPAWTNTSAIVTLTAPGSLAALPSNRFVQVQAEFIAGYYGVNVPKLKDFTVKWEGITRVCDIGGTFSKGPNYGIFEMTVDGQALVKGCQMDLTIYQDIRAIGGSNRVTSKTTAEIFPRNTGKGR